MAQPNSARGRAGEYASWLADVQARNAALLAELQSDGSLTRLEEIELIYNVYNDNEKVQKDLLTRLWYLVGQGKGGGKFVKPFWTQNDLVISERIDLDIQRQIDSHVDFIGEINPGVD